MTAFTTPKLARHDPLQARSATLRERGWWHSHRFLLLRRGVQLGVLLLFLLGPWAGLWLVKGNLSASLVLDVLPLADPLAVAQVLATRHWPGTAALQGVLLVGLFYALVGGRSYCSWVCPVNPVTDTAGWLRRKLRISTGRAPRDLRRWLLLAVILACAACGVTVWEWVNPVSLTQRALVFGGGVALASTAMVFLLDLLVAPRGWCGHLCPVGAAYALVGHKSLLRISARAASRCNDCADCYTVCPEPQVIPVPLKGKDGASPVILDSACTNCARCIDVCGPGVFVFTHRFDHKRV